MNAQSQTSGTSPAAVEIDGIVCFESEDSPGTWLYIPGAPVPEMVNGRPSLQLYASRDSGILQLGAHWTLTPFQSATVQKKIALLQQSGDVQLQPAPVSVQQSTVEFAAGKGERTLIARSSSSGYPPYAAMFRIVLTSEGKNLVTAALNGREGMLFVTYQVRARVKVSANAVLTGDIARACEMLSSSSTQTEIREWMERAIESRAIKLEVTGESSLANAAVLNAKAQFAAAIQSKLRGPEAAMSQSSTLRIESLSTGFVEQEFIREADISKWFPAGNGQDFITVA